MQFDWNKIQFKEDGKVLLLYRHERIFIEGLVKAGDMVLDVGGWGHFDARVRQEGGFCTVLDNFTQDQYYPDRVREFACIYTDICTIDPNKLSGPFTFDVVTCFETLEHVADQQAAVQNMYKFLKPGGFFAGTVPLPGFCHHEGDEDIAFLTEEDLHSLLETTGFIDILIEPTASIEKDQVPCSLYFRSRKGFTNV